VMSLSRSITACLHSSTPHNTSLTVIPLSINHQSAQYSHYLLQYRCWSRRSWICLTRGQGRSSRPSTDDSRFLPLAYAAPAAGWVGWWSFTLREPTAP
jgi:hypothetical protein